MTALDILKTALQPLGYQVHFDRAPKITSQYVILGSPADGRPLEEAVGDTAADHALELRVTCVVGTTAGARIMLQRIRDILSPGRRTHTLRGGDLLVSVRYLRSELVDVDTSVVITGTNTNPVWGVDTYQLVIQHIGAHHVGEAADAA